MVTSSLIRPSPGWRPGVNRAGREVAVVGVGYSDVTRRGEPDIRTMTRDAALDALDDAGLVATDLDAIFEYSFGMMRGDSPIAVSAQRLLGVPNLTAFNDIMGTGPFTYVSNTKDAAMAIAAGACETALVYRTITREAGHNGGLRRADALPGRCSSPRRTGMAAGSSARCAWKANRRRIAELGGSVEDYGQIALNARRWAALYPRAMFREPITMDDYLDSRMVADPLVLFDCDYPVNAACAAILTAAERAADLRARGPGGRARVRHREPADWLYTDDFLFGGTIPCARELWRRSTVTAADVDVAELYDGFTHIAISWLEALGLCGIGEFHDWVDDGARMAPAGRCPSIPMAASSLPDACTGSRS
jgi:acetyl-CoA acetyltransferase